MKNKILVLILITFTLTGQAVTCKRVPNNLLEFFRAHHRSYAASHPELSRKTLANKYAHLLAMALKESSGATVSVTDMRYGGSALSDQMFAKDSREEGGAQSSLAAMNKLLTQKSIIWNKQTNFGLLQMSADRLLVGNGVGARLKQRVEDLKNDFRHGPSATLDYCGTKLLFRDEEAALERKFEELFHCTVGATKKNDVICFGKWNMLCPAFNLEIALLAPLAYFQTRNASPVCQEKFKTN